MAGDQRLTFAEEYRGVAMMLGLDLEHSGRGQVAERNAAFDFRADNVAIHFVAEIGMRHEHGQVHLARSNCSEDHTRGPADVEGYLWRGSDGRAFGPREPRIGQWLAGKTSQTLSVWLCAEKGCQLLADGTGHRREYVI